MKISLRQYVQEGCELPKFYGIAYWEYWRNYAVAYPVPVNLVVCFGRWAWHELIKLRPTELDKMLRKAYDTGLSEGRLTKRTPDKMVRHGVGRVVSVSEAPDLIIEDDNSSRR